jgi:hypothetical protein
MRAVLTTQIPVHRVAAFAEMAWLERRPELGLICRAAREGKQRIDQRVIQATLPTLSEAGRKNVIQWCQDLGLCDKGGALTRRGHEVADSDEAPVPEQGTYGLWLAEHPVIGRRVLAASRLSASREQRLQELRPLPVQPALEQLFSSALDPNERFLVRALPEARGLVYGEGGHCELRWTLDFDQEENSWRLSGALSQPQGRHQEQHPILHEPESARLDLWALMKHWGAGPLRQIGEWRIQKRRLAVRFQNLSADIQERFRVSLRLGSVEVPGMGTYEGVVLENVPLAPLQKADAQQWAMARLKRHLDQRPQYRGRAALRDLFVGLVEDTPLADFSPTLPTHDDLPGALDADPVQRWLLRAPVDLALHPVPAELLASLQVAAEEANAAPPPRAGRSASPTRAPGRCAASPRPSQRAPSLTASCSVTATCAVTTTSPRWGSCSAPCARRLRR